MVRHPLAAVSTWAARCAANWMNQSVESSSVLVVATPALSRRLPVGSGRMLRAGLHQATVKVMGVAAKGHGSTPMGHG